MNGHLNTCSERDGYVIHEESQICIGRWNSNISIAGSVSSAIARSISMLKILWFDQMLLKNLHLSLILVVLGIDDFFVISLY